MSSDHRSPTGGTDNQQRRTEPEYEAPLYLRYQQGDTEVSNQSSQSGDKVEQCHRSGVPQQSQRLQRDHDEQNLLRHAGDDEQAIVRRDTAPTRAALRWRKRSSAIATARRRAHLLWTQPHSTLFRPTTPAASCRRCQPARFVLCRSHGEPIANVGSACEGVGQSSRAEAIMPA
jgi:hypothetical protein